jgi:hypothetical protein
MLTQVSKRRRDITMPSIIRECHVPHHGPCDTVLSAPAVLATLEAHGFEARQPFPGEVEAWEPATVVPLDGGPVRDASAWVAVPFDVHALAAWLGY